MAGEYTMPRLVVAERRRQEVLDWLNQNQSASVSEVVAALPHHDEKALRGAVSAMILTGEITSTGERRAKRLVAVKTTTASAAELLARKRHNSRKALAARAERERTERARLIAGAPIEDTSELSKFEKAELDARRAIAWLRDNPGASAHSVGLAIGLSSDARALQLMTRMERHGRAKRCGMTRSGSGKPCAAWVIDDSADIERSAKRETWRITHIGGCDENGNERGPLRNQGGQGALVRPAIGSGMYGDGGAW